MIQFWHFGGDYKFLICGNPKFLSLVFSEKARVGAGMAKATQRERCADVQMGNQNVVEALS